jgi:hypothetical protein
MVCVCVCVCACIEEMTVYQKQRALLSRKSTGAKTSARGDVYAI